jgi:hypothetical protein
MHQASENLALRLEAPHDVDRLEATAHELDRDLLPVLRVVTFGEVNLTHATPSDRSYHPVAADVGADQGIGVRVLVDDEPTLDCQGPVVAVYAQHGLDFAAQFAFTGARLVEKRRLFARLEFERGHEEGLNPSPTSRIHAGSFPLTGEKRHTTTPEFATKTRQGGHHRCHRTTTGVSPPKGGLPGPTSRSPALLRLRHAARRHRQPRGFVSILAARFRAVRFAGGSSAVVQGTRTYNASRDDYPKRLPASLPRGHWRTTPFGLPNLPAIERWVFGGSDPCESLWWTGQRAKGSPLMSWRGAIMDEPNEFTDFDAWEESDDTVFETEKEVQCPHCGESVVIGLDPGGGPLQDYVEDCAVCCRPWQVQVHYDESGSAQVTVEPS